MSITYLWLKLRLTILDLDVVSHFVHLAGLGLYRREFTGGGCGVKSFGVVLVNNLRPYRLKAIILKFAVGT